MPNAMTINPIGTLFQYIQWDEYEGFIRNPFAFYFLIDNPRVCGPS